MSFLFSWILLISISLTIAIQLDGNCANANTACEGTGIECAIDTCQCIAPHYIPCNSSCVANRHTAYEGDQCRVQENCVENTVCSGNRCICIPDYTPIEGLCFKRLTASCSNHAECWSQNCLNSQCACAVGYEPQEDGHRCRRKFVHIYRTWAEANQAQAFCSDSSSCIHNLAECYNDTQHPTAKFCKCPYGYNLEATKQLCESIKSSLLSPLNPSPTTYEECGICTDTNAACIQADKQKTCWCRSGYVNKNGKCEKQERPKPLVVFPNLNDTIQHDFTSNCGNVSSNVTNRLCVCAPGYKFIAKDKPCEIIKPVWHDSILEYGVCTRITSRDTAINENGVCPTPLKCEAREDKHVCTCGKNQFLDLDDPTKCVYYIGQAATSPGICPTKNAERSSNSSICECRAGYQATDGNRKCEVKLSENKFESSCSSNRSNDIICTGVFGRTAQLCNIGDCRCNGNQSFSNNDKTHCYALLNQVLISPTAECPPNSTLDANRCRCNAGFGASNNLRECVSMQPQLVQNTGSPINPSANLTTADCEAKFESPVEAYDNGVCQCKNGSVLNNDKTGCWYRLNFIFAQTEKYPLCPPNSSAVTEPVCVCDLGFIRNGTECVPIIDKVYLETDTTAPSINGLTAQACVKWFGTGASLSANGKYCVCKPTAYPVKSNTYCHFLIDEVTSEIKGTSTCPANTKEPLGPPSACLCKTGFHVSANRQTCDTRNIDLVDIANVTTPHPDVCVSYTNADCTAKFGEQAFCRDEKCYCDRRLSFINNGKCESLTNYVFPGLHERDSYSCDKHEDCGNNDVLECGYLLSEDQYKVCKCKDGALFDPTTQTCVKNRCNPACNTNLKFRMSGTGCTNTTSELQLNQPCYRTALWEFDQIAGAQHGLKCDLSCGRARCISGWKPEGKNCVLFEMENDKCVYNENACQQIDINAICNRDENQCSCKRSYYYDGKTCVRAVDSDCEKAEDCGGEMECIGNRCRCNAGQRQEETPDLYGQIIGRCINNGVGQVRFSPVLLFVFCMLIQGLFA